jgi:two-component system response regulator FixJ
MNGAREILSRPFPDHERLTQHERAVTAQIVRGASSKETGPALDITQRTVGFHRANIMGKLGAQNTADLVRKVVAK